MQRVEKVIFSQADRTPDAVAVEHNGARLSYRELKQQAFEISRELRGSGLVAGETVAICQHRSLTTLPLILGILAAGGVVVPINPRTPVRMLERIIHDSAPRFVFNESSITPAAGSLNGNRAPAHPEDVCYVIYTSGSEGSPKGVVGSHKSLIHYLRWQAKEFAVNEDDRFSQTAPLSFDFSLKELLVPLVCGARVCLADRSTVIDARRFVAWVRESRITVMCCVPTLLRSILNSRAEGDAFESLRALLISGDMLRWEDVAGWRERFGNDIALFNLYGPTESTVIKAFYPIPETRLPESINVPVGRPIDDTDILIVDENSQPGQPGTPTEIGEIVIVSEYLARGYLNGNANSGGRFCKLEYQGQQRKAYRTGDLGRWLSDGNLELMGRRDRQVKIRGYRIELNEIESILSTCEAISDVAVLTLQSSTNLDTDEPAVIACCFTSRDPGLTEKDVRNYAKERLLPQVLSLTRFYRFDKLPLTVNGKVDRNKLESMIATEVEEVTQTSRETSSVRDKILAMWEQLLSLEGINPEANFFELGGDSMTAIRLLRRLREEVHPDVKLDDIYEFPSVSQLSNRVAQLLSEQVDQSVEQRVEPLLA